ncbi:hypothetical protein [Carboxylicivirga marina]|uniref:hypothetical protein n=1 Tax=Carboxylicivirga marina TaxID=2800988 RepID=UPI002598CF3F|nr:hypothetical protein [uncultured Carboxylicivirga sp.]
MKRYFVITHTSEDNSHINEQDLLPASCQLITGLAVIATVKKQAEVIDVSESLAFPQALITDLLNDERITDLFYSYLRTRADEADSRAFFESNILPEIIRVLTNGIVYSCLDKDEQQELSEHIAYVFNQQFTDFIYGEGKLFANGQAMTNLDFTDFIAQQALIFTYQHKDQLFKRTVKAYKQPEAYECGNISLLVNGNSFLLRDYMVTANRKVKNLHKELIPFHEPLEVNSNLYTVFKSNKNSGDNILTIRIYIEYEVPSKKELQLSNLKPESNEHE